MTAVPVQPPEADTGKRTLRQVGFGFAFWLSFLLVLEPGNLIRAARTGLHLGVASEALRMVCAALLGAAVTPGVLRLSRQFPVRRADSLRNGAVLAGCLVTLALAMIVAGALASAWLPPNAIRGSVAEQVAANLLLLTVALAVLAAAPQLRDLRAEAIARRSAPPSAIPVKRRGETLLIKPGDIDWIEAQGNYLALHVGRETHLIRGVLGRMELQLDGGRFVRIHRRSIVNVERIRRVRPAASGDAVIELGGGVELRVSRNYAKALKDRLPA